MTLTLSCCSRRSSMKRKSTFVALKSQKKGRISKQVDGQEIQEPRSYLIDLPDCIVFDILLRLPLKSILMCKCVCKSFHRLISDPEFTKLHFKQSQVEVLIRNKDSTLVARTLYLLDFKPEKFEGDDLTSKDRDFCLCVSYPVFYCKGHVKLQTTLKFPLRDADLGIDKKIAARIGGSKRRYIACKPKEDMFDVVNSCNGLVCLCDPRDKSPLAVCNPVTGEFLRLPNPVSLVKEKVRIDCGFGFHPTTNEYKVIRMYKKDTYTQNYGRRLSENTVVEIHTLGTKIWRTVGKHPNFSSNMEFPTCVNGALHWIAYPKSKKRTVVSFNFESESFQFFSCPPPVKIYESHSPIVMSLGELRGCLYVCVASAKHVKFWLMKEYGVGESWTMLFSINIFNQCSIFPGAYLPIKFFENGAILIYKYHSNFFVYCEPGKRHCKCFKVGDRDIPYKFETISITPSLILLKDVVKGDNVEVLNVYSRCGLFKLHEEDCYLYLAKQKDQEEFFLSYEEQN